MKYGSNTSYYELNRRQLLFKFPLDLITLYVPQHLLKVLVVGEVNPLFLGHERQDVHDLRYFEFRVGIDIEFHLLAQLSDPRLAVLGNEDDDRQKYRLERYEHGEESKGKRIHRLEIRDVASVPNNPKPKQGRIECKKTNGAER